MSRDPDARWIPSTDVDALEAFQHALARADHVRIPRVTNGRRAAARTGPPLVSVIVPSRHELENVPILLEGLSRVDVGDPIEVVVVDDSDDDTAIAAEHAARGLRRADFRISVVHRAPRERDGGLSGAVVAGIRATAGTWICVMDADLQHPPELVGDLVTTAIGRRHDLVVASRYCRGGSSAGLARHHRRITSRAATTATRACLPGGGRRVTDPMSGFFVVRRSVLDVERLHPRGFKILLEILGRHPGLDVAEVPFSFGERLSGRSKASLAQGLSLMRQITELRRASAAHRTPTHRYDIHGIVRVESDRLLPELDKFEVADLDPGPVIRVHVAPLTGVPRGENIDLTGRSPAVSYVERMGFGVRVQVDGEEIDVRVSPYVARSPHVLYTNVVEPLLRWHLVSLDHALVHAACVADGDDAYLVTARTDTGKTTTMLKVLDRAPLAFLSDDLVVVRRDGTVLTYPKPLTISAHTVHALRRTDLTRRERVALVPQSRLHSREGRQLAFLLTRYRLPVASISALVQRLVPPPKYHIERLVDGVRSGRSARARGMFVIERGGTGGEPIPPHRALQILLANCEDAFGFPPYETLERLIHSISSDDLRSRERAIIADALAGVSAELLRSETLDWAERIAERVRVGAVPTEPPLEELYQRTS